MQEGNSGGPVFPAQRGEPPHPADPGAPGGHPGAGPAFPEPVRTGLQEEGRRLLAGRAAEDEEVLVAGERPGAAERRGARRPSVRRPADRPQRPHPRDGAAQGGSGSGPRDAGPGGAGADRHTARAAGDERGAEGRRRATGDHAPGPELQDPGAEDRLEGVPEP